MAESGLIMTLLNVGLLLAIPSGIICLSIILIYFVPEIYREDFWNFEEEAEIQKKPHEYIFTYSAAVFLVGIIFLAINFLII